MNRRTKNKTELRGQVIKRPFLSKEECLLNVVTARESYADKTRERLNKSLVLLQQQNCVIKKGENQQVISLSRFIFMCRNTFMPPLCVSYSHFVERFSHSLLSMYHSLSLARSITAL